MKSYSLKFLKEIIPVVAGILIALFINNWNTEAKDKAFVEQVLSTVSSELKDTQKDIIEKIPMQEAMIDSLDHYSRNSSITVSDIVMKSKGIYIPQVKLNAWKAVSTTKIDLVDYKKITLLSNIEESKNLLSNKTNFLMNFLYSNINQTDRNTKLTFKMLIKDMVQTEKTIQENIELYEQE